MSALAEAARAVLEAWDHAEMLPAMRPRMKALRAALSADAEERYDVRDVAPCASITVDDAGKVVGGEVYAPGLPAGRHRVWPVPVSVEDAQRASAEERRCGTCRWWATSYPRPENFAPCLGPVPDAYLHYIGELRADNGLDPDIDRSVHLMKLDSAGQSCPTWEGREGEG